METEEVRLEGRRLAGRYLLEEEVASGGMGSLWRARDEVLGRLVAVKVLHDRLARDDAVLERFRQEAVAAARLSHPNVVRVFDTGVDESVCYIVMELVEGRTVEEMLSDGPLPPAEAAAIVRDVLQGLAHAHREGVIHRDVKPANILVDAGGLVKVTDFGIAKAAFAGDDLTTTGNLIGTARYLAPEQVEGHAVDARSDLYAAGIVLYEALTGRPPFQAETHIATATMRLTKDPTPPGSMRPGIPRDVDAVTMRALARDPDARYQTAEEMSAALDRATPQAPPPIPAPVHQREEPIRAQSSFFRSWMMIPLVLLLLGALAVGAFVFLEGAGEEGGGGGPTDEETTAEPLRNVQAASHDPEGGDGEHDEEVRLAIDGNADTYWTTEGYEQDLGIEKEGVGLLLRLRDEAEITELTIQTETPGWDFEVHVGDEANGLQDEPGVTADGDDSFVAEETTTLELDDPAVGRYVLIWITGLVQADGYRAHVNEVEVVGAGG